MEKHGYILESLYRSLESSYKGSIVKDHYGPLLWRKHPLQEGRIEFSSYIPIINSLPEEARFNLQEDLNLLQKESENWVIPLEEISSNGSKIILKLSRVHAFREVVTAIIKAQGKYGDSLSQCRHVEVLKSDNDWTKDLTNYRVKLFEDITEKLLHHAGYSNANDVKTVARLAFSTKCQKSTREGVFNIYCGKVQGDSSGPLYISTQEYIELRENDIREIAAHKYWESSRESDVKKLAAAAVTVDLVQTKPNISITIQLGEKSKGNREDSSKGAVFILYNYARITSIMNKYETLVSQHGYPAIPAVEDIDLSLLTQQDEWLILFNFLLEYPSAIRRAVENVEDGDVSPHIICVFTSKLCHAFSVYYRHVRILLENRAHLNATMFARLSLVTAIERVLSHAMNILNLPRIQHM